MSNLSLDWQKNLCWFDSASDEPGEYFMFCIPSSLSLEKIEEHYYYGFYLVDRLTKKKLSLDDVREMFSCESI